MEKIIQYNNIEFRLVRFHGEDRHPKTKNAFYVNNGHGGVQGLRLYPDGRMVLVNAHMKAFRGNGTKQEYLVFYNAWGNEIHIYASHAVFIAWVGPMKPGMTIDHINGCTTDNQPENLRQLDIKTNQRDGGFSRKLTHKGFDTRRIDRVYLLRYFDRMAKIKIQVSIYRYQRLTREDLRIALFEPSESFCFAHFEQYRRRKKP